MKGPKDRKPCLTPITTEKYPASMFTKKGNNLRSTQNLLGRLAGFHLVGGEAPPPPKKEERKKKE
jgi:hypothetical protein